MSDIDVKMLEREWNKRDPLNIKKLLKDRNNGCIMSFNTDGYELLLMSDESYNLLSKFRDEIVLLAESNGVQDMGMGFENVIEDDLDEDDDRGLGRMEYQYFMSDSKMSLRVFAHVLRGFLLENNMLVSVDNK